MKKSSDEKLSFLKKAFISGLFLAFMAWFGYWTAQDGAPVAGQNHSKAIPMNELVRRRVEREVRTQHVIDRRDATQPGAGGEGRSEAQTGYSHLEGNMVEFRVENGLAIAHGDVILGKPDANFSGKRGVTEVRVPELWSGKTIPYAISRDLPNPKRVEKALEYLRLKTAVNFVPVQGERDAIVFEKGDKHCYSYLGRMKGLQPIYLSSECGWTEILHEILHALGFIHEQSRPDRDGSVEIIWDNIEQEYWAQFDKAPEAWSENLRDAPAFDFNSVMLYRHDAFGKKPGLLTMRPKVKTKISPVESGLSEGDIRRVNHIYGLHD